MHRKMLQWLFPKKEQSQKTVRYAFPLVLLTAVFASLAATISQDISFITITPNVNTLEKDQIFTIDVQATVHVPVNAVDIILSYPENRMIVEGIDTGTSVITLWTQDPYAKDGNIYLQGGTFRKGFVGEHTIARIKARATESGKLHVYLKDSQLVAGDGKGTEVAVVDSAGKSEATIIVMNEAGDIAGEARVELVTDTDGDGDVDLGDLSAFMSAWFRKDILFDFNGDGRMTFRDFSILLADSFFK